MSAHKWENTTEPSGGLPPNRLHQGGVLEAEGQGRSYVAAAGEAVATNASQPWNIFAAFGRDAVTYIADHLPGRHRRQRRRERRDEEQGEASGRGLVHKDSTQCRAWCQEQKRRKEQRRRAAQGDASADEDAEPSVPSVLTQQQAGNASAAAAVDELPDQDTQHQAPEQDEEIQEEVFDDVSLASGRHSLDKDKEGIGRKSSGADSQSSTDPAAPTRVDITASALPSGHYDPKNDVILRVEAMSATETRTIVVMLYLATVIATAFLIEEFTQKFTNPDGAFRNHKYVVWSNVVVGGVCFLMLTKTLYCVVWRVWRSIRLGMRWTPRRRKCATLVFVELVTVYIDVLSYLITNIYLLAAHCDWFSLVVPYTSTIQLTCYNTIFLLFCIHAHNGNPWARPVAGSMEKRRLGDRDREDAIVMDASFRHHWPKFILWAVFEGQLMLVLYWYVSGRGDASKPTVIPPGLENNCDDWLYSCITTPVQQGLIGILVAIGYVYFFLYLYFIGKAYLILRGLPYTQYKMGNLMVRLHLRLRLTIILFFAFSFALLWFVRSNTCSSYLTTWGGMLPLQVVTTAVVVAWSYFTMPMDPDARTPILGVWLQEFAWTEEEKAERLSIRSSSGVCPDTNDGLSKEPMFCFETAMNMLYWSALVYDYEEALDSKLSLDTAMSLYGLEHSELFWEKALDTKLLMAWNKHTIVLAFRGTASFANALADLQAWQTPHPPVRGSWWRHRPRVHLGFWKSWTANGLNRRVCARIMAILRSPDVDSESVKVYVTGHSLGGALATLAAHEFRTVALSYGVDRDLACYTFGAPRVGNHAFAREFNNVAPDTWHIINDQDVVAKAPKFLVLYKRAGHRTVINRMGDMIVRPSFIEITMRNGNSSVAHHMLGSYQRSLLAILLAQFTKKRFSGGMAGVVRLASSSEPVQELLLEEAGLDMAALRRLSRWGALAPQIGAKINATLRKRTTGSLPIMRRSPTQSVSGGLAKQDFPSSRRLSAPEPMTSVSLSGELPSTGAAEGLVERAALMKTATTMQLPGAGR
ncbi:hypothetical protein WJX75_002353 [Coccomyxa subellipsoidea]|uniref:Fungal lipase-type domain-containing protein n=1 Tax=Coccomyxa subellipsoidea TaxID=248742 RepID=A0ABR2YCA3_9CHLO